MLAPFDVASVTWQGMRAYQEDSIAEQFDPKIAQGFAIVADGMGGHAAGDVASQLVASQGSAKLQAVMQSQTVKPEGLPAALDEVIDTGNAAIEARVKTDPRVAGMGTTVLAIALVQDELYWGSVGDSPLYLIRDGAISQLNQDHSMAPILAARVQSGDLTAEEAKQHPDRNALTSVLMGEAIELRDVPRASFALQPGDLLIAASDGLQYLDNADIRRLVVEQLPASSAQICQSLIAALEGLGDTHQDNVAIVVIQRRATTQAEAVSDGGQATEGDATTDNPHEDEEPEDGSLEASPIVDDASGEAASPPHAAPETPKRQPSMAHTILVLLGGLVAVGFILYFLTTEADGQAVQLFHDVSVLDVLR